LRRGVGRCPRFREEIASGEARIQASFITAVVTDVESFKRLVICDFKTTCIFWRMTAEEALKHPFIAADSDFGLAAMQEMVSQTSSCVHLPPR